MDKARAPAFQLRAGRCPVSRGDLFPRPRESPQSTGSIWVRGLLGTVAKDGARTAGLPCPRRTLRIGSANPCHGDRKTLGMMGWACPLSARDPGSRPHGPAARVGPLPPRKRGVSNRLWLQPRSKKLCVLAMPCPQLLQRLPGQGCGAGGHPGSGVRSVLDTGSHPHGVEGLAPMARTGPSRHARLSPPPVPSPPLLCLSPPLLQTLPQGLCPPH